MSVKITRRWMDTGDDTLGEIAMTLAQGGVVLLPTDTIYGLHALAGDAEAVARVAEIKGRDRQKPFVVLAATAEQIRDLGAIVPAVLWKIWPAPVTAVLQKRNGTIAARIPALPWLLALLKRTGPLVSTSANPSGEQPITHPVQLGSAFLSRLDGVLDQGVAAGEPSVIVDFTESSPRVIREGEPVFTQKLRKTLRKSL